MKQETKTQCAKCKTQLRERDFVRKTVTNLSCPKCENLISTSFGESFTREDAITTGDLTTLDEFINALKNEKFEIGNVNIFLNERHWEVKLSTQFLCKIEYSEWNHRSFSITVFVKKPSHEITIPINELLEKSQILCAKTATEIHLRGSKEIEVGSSQRFSIGIKIPHQLFPPTITRLSASLEDILKTFF